MPAAPEMNASNQPERVRLFVAFSVPPEVKKAIETAQDQIRRGLPEPSARWTRPEQFHLTLKFLGSVAFAQVPQLSEALRLATVPFAPLRLTAASLGFFPNARRPRVLWVGVSDAAGQLLPVQKAVEAATRTFTSEGTEERFSGHVTLARFKEIRGEDAQKLAMLTTPMHERVFGEWTAAGVELIRSQLSPTGASYTTVAVAPFQGGPGNRCEPAPQPSPR